MIDDKNIIFNIQLHLYKLKNIKKIKIYIFEYFYHLRQLNLDEDYISLGKRNFYQAILSHPNYNNLKDVWFPLPLNEEFSQYMRKKTIKKFLDD